MKRKHIENGIVYSEEEWRSHRMGVDFAAIVCGVALFLMIVFVR